MAIFVSTTQPRKLLEDIKKEINDKKIDTWLYDNDGDFYHAPNQWKFKAWLRPTIETNRLVFGIVGQENVNLSTIKNIASTGVDIISSSAIVAKAPTLDLGLDCK